MIDESLIKYVNLLWRRAWLLVLGAGLAAGAAFTAGRLTTPIYAATATLLVNEAPTANQTDPASIVIKSERLARTYATMMTQWPVLQEAIDQLKIPLTPDQLARQVTVTPIRDTQLLQLEVQDEDPQRAAALANTIPEVFSRQNEAMQAARYADAKANLERQMEEATAQIEQTQHDLNAATTSAAPTRDLDLLRLQSELTQRRQTYDRLSENLQNIRLAQAQSSSNIVVTEAAQPPTEPVRPRPVRDALLAGLVGLMLATGLVFLIEYLDNTVRTPEQVDAVLKTPVIGIVARLNGVTRRKPADAVETTSTGHAARLVAVKAPRSPAAEAFRTLRTNVQIAGVDHPIKTLLITSPGPNEGKSTVAANLAVVMSQAGRAVTLVDADLRRPMIHRLFSQSNHGGLTGALLDKNRDWFTALMPTAVSDLMTVPSGALPPNPSELLGSKRMQEFLARLKETNDVVVVDTPPLLPVTDALVLAPQADGVILVVEHGRTHLRAAQQALAQLHQAGARVLGVVINMAPTGRHGYGYYYYHQYYPGDEASANGRPDGGEGGGAAGATGTGPGRRARTSTAALAEAAVRAR